nr:hypothetical protein [Microbacterium pseudoresistens]
MFEDLEDQLASGWEAERAALDAEAERVRFARIELRARLAALVADAPALNATLTDGTTMRGRLRATGADWAALDLSETHSTALLPFGAVVQWGLDHGSVLASGSTQAPLSPLRERMTMGFVLRDLARRRTGVALRVRPGTLLAGTIDRAGSDHLDLALHDAGEARRSHAVRGFRLIPFDAVMTVIVGDTAGSALG